MSESLPDILIICQCYNTDEAYEDAISGDTWDSNLDMVRKFQPAKYFGYKPCGSELITKCKRDSSEEKFEFKTKVFAWVKDDKGRIANLLQGLEI